jgi:hypothetical protein
MAGLAPAIHVFLLGDRQDVDARVKPAHDGIKYLGAMHLRYILTRLFAEFADP